MPESKYRTKCYCTEKPFSCQHDLALNGKYGRSVLGKHGLTPDLHKADTKSNSKYVFVKLKRSNNEPTSGKISTFPQGQAHFHRRSSTSTIVSSATPYASCNSSGSGRVEILPENVNLTTPQVKQLKYSDRRTFYEYLHKQSELHADLETIVDVAAGSVVGTYAKTETDVRLFDPAYLRALQEFRLCNRTECFSSLHAFDRR